MKYVLTPGALDSLPPAELMVGRPQAGIGEVDYVNSHNQHIYREQVDLKN